MRVTICDFPDEARHQGAAWDRLTTHCARSRPDVVVLPEMAFCDWSMFTRREVDAAAWREALARHDEMIGRLGEIGAALVLGSRPIEQAGRRLNQAFAWTTMRGYLGAHCKHHLPDEPDGWEASWFDRGDLDFTPVAIDGITVGFQLCTELLLSDVSRAIGSAGAHLIAAPRATGGHRRWHHAGAMAAIMSGCFVLSANRRSLDGDAFPGGGWCFSPEGEVLAATAPERPFADADLDLAAAEQAKSTYPRNLLLD